jgi:hypothetical protein
VRLDESSHRLQFTLKTILALMAGLGIAIANWRLVLAFTSGFFWPTTIAVAYVFVLIGYSARSLLMPPSSGIARRTMLRAIFVISFCIAATLLWSRHRWFGWFDDEYWPPKTFPYPDAMLVAFHDWIDATFPATDSSIKIHGEFYSVLISLNILAWSASAWFGFQLGLLLRPTVLVGFRRWCVTMVPLRRNATEPSDARETSAQSVLKSKSTPRSP